jgi:hypothetical protein
MQASSKILHVGAMDPELQNSPIVDDLDEDAETVRQQVPGEPVCHFNGRAFANGALVRSGTQILKCRYGVWMDVGSSDPDNP